MVDLNPTLGREQAGYRPAVIVSADRFNHGPADLVIVVPVTTTDRKQPIHVRIEPPDGGLDRVSFAMCEAVRSVSKQRLAKYCGDLDANTLYEIRRRIGLLLKVD